MSVAHDARKNTCPALSPTILHRESLIRRLNEVIAGPAEGFSHYKLVLLNTPAGYGKTTLLADFARNAGIPCCWYFLDRTDIDPTTFLEGLLASIQHRFPQFGLMPAPLLASVMPDNIKDPAGNHYEAVVDALIASIEKEGTERFALFLCNYQEVNACQAVNKLVNHLLWKLPARCVLVIESRAMPDLECASLIARREMVGIGLDLLRFTSQDIRDLAQLQGMEPLDNAEAEQLAMSFEGWITGILLGTRLGDVQFLQRKNCDHFPSESQKLQMDQQLLFPYVVNEVFKHDPEMFAFLKDVSVLQEMTPLLCGELLGIADAAERFQYLEQNGLFVTHHGEGSQVTYACHPVLRDLLYNELRYQSPERFVMLHRRAAELLSARYDYEKAVYHALEVSADETAARFIIDSYEQVLAQGHVETLARWIDVLPAMTTARYPKLLLIRANIHLMLGDHSRALSLLEAASKAIMHPSPVVDLVDIPLLQAESVVLRSKALFQLGEYHQVQLLCQQMQEHLPTDEVKLRAEVHTRLGVCAIQLGDYTAALAQLQKALQLWGRHTTGRQVAELHSVLASVYSLLGNFALSEHYISRAITCWEQLHDEWGKTNNMVRLGLIKLRQGAFSDAEEAFTQALKLASGPIRFQRGQAYALINLGDLYQNQELYEKSLEVTEDGLALARQLKDKYIANVALCILAMTYLYMGDTATAMLLVSETDVRDAYGERLSYEQALRELTFGTILLYQHFYDEAYRHLSKMETPLNTMGLKREQIQLELRLAACLLELGQTAEWTRRVDEMATLLSRQNVHKHLVLIELHRLPRLYQAVETMPEMVRLREQLHLGVESPEAAITSPLLEQSPPPVFTETSHPKLVIQAFGEPAVLLQDRLITHWRMARSMELFFFLLDCGRPMRKEQIITALWAEVDEQINQTFHSTIHYLRKALEAPCVVSQGGTYKLDLASYYGDNVWYDVMAFQQHQAQAKQALGVEDDAAAKEALLTMVELYRSDYAQPFYSDWCTFRRDELQRAYLDARRHLAQLAWRKEQFDESASHWQHMLAVDNCLEDVHYGLMRCYLRQGKRGLALRQYQRCRDTLQRELAVQPGSAVQNLYQRLMGYG